MIDLPDEQKNLAKRLQENLHFYSQNCLKIKNKVGALVPFTFNRVQEFLHEKLEDQRRRIGKVRALVLKGRQEGCTTYIEGRYFQKASWNFGVAVGTLSHLSDTTDKLYSIINRFYENLPPKLKPFLPTNNSRKIKFAGIDSEWDLGTAGSDEIGRGGTLQLFHGSEVAFWPHPEKIRAGIMQSVADLPGTEIILESTANGFDAFFYAMCKDAMQHVGEFELIFVPWFWAEEYRKPIPEGAEFVRTDQEQEITELYELDDEQLNWRRNKILELGGVHEFRKEYPCNPMEAFQTSGDSFISAEKVLQARKRKLDKKLYQFSPLIMGVDKSRTHDRTVISFRRGQKLLKVFVYDPRAKLPWQSEDGRVIVEPMEELTEPIIAGICANFLRSYEPLLCNIDVGDGWGVVDLLRQQGFAKTVRPVLFHEKADDPRIHANKRSEIIHRTRDWIHGDDGEVDIPDADMIQADLCCMPKPKYSSNSRKIMPPKDEIIKKFGMSPDILESVALTFAFLVENVDNPDKSRSAKEREGKRGLITLKKKRKKNLNEFNPQNIFARGD